MSTLSSTLTAQFCFRQPEGSKGRFDTCKVTVRFWMRRFDHQGPSGLWNEPRSGWPLKAGETVRTMLKDLVDQDP